MLTKCELECANLKIVVTSLFTGRVFRLVCNSTHMHTHNCLQTYESLWRYTAATSIPPTWRRLLL